MKTAAQSKPCSIFRTAATWSKIKDHLFREGASSKNNHTNSRGETEWSLFEGVLQGVDNPIAESFKSRRRFLGVVTEIEKDVRNMAGYSNAMRVAVLAAVLALPIAEAASAAGAIERACRQSERSAASPSLCRCIQSVANRRLNRSERKVVSTWLLDPQEAQIVSRSDRRSDESLWQRYQEFGDAAARSCS